MSRIFKKISLGEFREKFTKFRDSCVEDSGYYAWPTVSMQIQKDLKVDFDWENFEEGPGSFGPEGLMGFHVLSNGMPFIGMCAGGDWEEPVFFIAYFDSKKMRAYIPTAGNPWNTETNCAYGNNDLDDINKSKRNDLPINQDFDSKLIIEDILKHFKEKK